MTIVDVEIAMLDAGYLRSTLFQQRLASPMSAFAEFAANRALWMWPSEKVITILRDKDGVEGVSITNGGRVVATILHDQFARLIRGRAADDIAEIWEILVRSSLPFDRSGYAMMAVAAVDIALWDMKSKRERQTLTTLTGGVRNRDLRAYVTTGVPERFAQTAFSGIKVPIPGGPHDGPDGVAENIAIVRRAREAAGDDRDVMIDAFMAWDVDYTLRMFEALQPYRVRWFEDPLPPNNIRDFEALKRAGGDALHLALGNFSFSRWDCNELLSAGVVSVLQPDIAWCGGVTEALRIVALANMRQTDVIFHNTSEQPWALALSQSQPGVCEVEYVDRDSDSMLHQLFEGGASVIGARVIDDGTVGHSLSSRARGAMTAFEPSR